MSPIINPQRSAFRPLLSGIDCEKARLPRSPGAIVWRAGGAQPSAPPTRSHTSRPLHAEGGSTVLGPAGAAAGVGPILESDAGMAVPSNWGTTPQQADTASSGMVEPGDAFGIYPQQGMLRDASTECWGGLLTGTACKKGETVQRIIPPTLAACPRCSLSKAHRDPCSLLQPPCLKGFLSRGAVPRRPSRRTFVRAASSVAVRPPRPFRRALPLVSSPP